MALTIVQARLIEFTATQIIEHIALMNRIEAMTEEECLSQLAAGREVKKFQRERLDSH